MDELKKDKIQALQAQAKYLRYLAEIYPRVSPRSNSNPFQTHSSYDELPIKSSQKSFQELLEQQLQQHPPPFSLNRPQTLHQATHKHALTLNFRPSRLKVLQNRLKWNESQRYNIFYMKVSRLKEGFDIRSKDMITKETRSIVKSQQEVIEELGKLKQSRKIVKSQQEVTEELSKLKELRKDQSKRAEIDRLRKVFEGLKVKEKKTERKQRAEIESLKGELEKLRKMLREIQSKTDKEKRKSGEESENITPEKVKDIGRKVERANISVRKKFVSF